jgi:hypothetical protein
MLLTSISVVLRGSDVHSVKDLVATPVVLATNITGRERSAILTGPVSLRVSRLEHEANAADAKAMRMAGLAPDLIRILSIVRIRVLGEALRPLLPGHMSANAATSLRQSLCNNTLARG